MSKNNKIKREARKFSDCINKPQTVMDYEREKNKLVALNESQRQYISSLKHDNFVIGAGSAGTGKTYIAARIAGQLYLEDKSIRNIILTRPNVEVGQKMGYLPGDLEEKYAPYVIPFEKGLKDELGLKLESDLYKKILPKPLAYMRGETFDNSVILLDEAQNCTIEEIKLICSRIGTDSRMFVSGDTKQSDLTSNKENGLAWLMRQIKGQGLPIDIIEFKATDCVRSDMCRMFLRMFDNEI
jgi:phosphate starvation-inducible PhoH-like protein